MNTTRTRSPRDTDDLGVRVRVFEEYTRQRLAQGAEAMAQLRAQIEELQPKPKPIWPGLSIAVTVFAMVLVWVWQAARYPDRGEFDRLVRSQVDESFTIRERMRQIEIEQTKQTQRIEALEKQKNNARGGMR